ncbi:hypothetical protein AB0M46_39395 [Dactylosporangium sp. NPDC051485]|uniref:LppU/SCO3897 family protein n=1 Tax=Dactylosporangium sp. NPDC051485 TaxID=3154846 RepID=UPI003412EF27
MTTPAEPAAPPAKPGKRRQIRILVGIVVLLGVLLGAAWFFNRDAALNAKVGECLHQVGSDQLRIVPCDSAEADFTVLGKIGDKDQSEASSPFSTVCQQWSDTTSMYWQGEKGSRGDVLCLRTKR